MHPENSLLDDIVGAAETLTEAVSNLTHPVSQEDLSDVTVLASVLKAFVDRYRTMAGGNGRE